MIIRLNTENIEEIHRDLLRVFSECDESFASLKYLIAQISEDKALLLYPDTYSTLENLQNAGSRLFAMKDRMFELCKVLAPVSGNFTSCENQIEEKIRQIHLQLSVISACTDTIIRDGFSEMGFQSSSESLNDSLAKLLTGNVCSYQIANLAPINLALENRYNSMGDKL